MHLDIPHPLANLSVAEAKAIQTNLADRVSLEDDPRLGDIRLVAGIDNAYLKTAAHTTSFAAVVVLSWPELDEVEVATASGRLRARTCWGCSRSTSCTS